MTMTKDAAPGADPEIASICARFDNDPHRMLDILLAVQEARCQIAPDAMDAIAAAVGRSRVAVEGVASFYSFLSSEPQGRVVVRICDDIVDRFAGMDAVVKAFEAGLGIALGQTSADGAVSLELTPCIGLCDQAPAAMVGERVVTRLTPARAGEIARALRAGQSATEALGLAGYVQPLARVQAQVDSQIRVGGPVLLGEAEADAHRDAGLRAAMAMAPAQIVAEVEASGLRGCGGAGFGTAAKWRMAAETPAARRFVLCNADEGEPGTFKDRVLLTERADLVFEGMTIAARAVGAAEGIVYLRGEYRFLSDHLQAVLACRRARGVLGQDFDIRIQMGAGAYVCGEEGALISSCEGLPGEPKTRPPFPVTKGYLGHPTVVNNVETFAHVARILARGAAWFAGFGTAKSRGTKLFSVSGDCARPGVYELPWGTALADLLALAGGADAAAVQVGGPSGQMVGPVSFGRALCHEDLACGGAVVVFSAQRNIVEIVDHYMAFFGQESCGYCTPCRVGTVFLKKAVERLRAGLATPADIDHLKALSATIVQTSRCGLGQSAPQPILSSLAAFPLVYAALTRPEGDGLKPSFNIQAALDGARGIAKRRSYIFDKDFSQ